MSNNTVKELTATASRNEILSGMNARLNPLTSAPDVVQYGNNSYAFPVELSDGTTRWFKLELTIALHKATATARAFDPEEKRAEWLADCEAKRAKAAEAAEKKARKIAADEARRAAQAAAKPVGVVLKEQAV